MFDPGPGASLSARDSLARPLKDAWGSPEASPSHVDELVSSLDGVFWERDYRTQVITYVSSNVERFVGYSADEFRTEPEFFENIVWPADRSRILEVWDAIRCGARHLECEYRVVARDGSVRWVRDRISVVEEEGNPIRLRGLAVDVTERKALEARQSEGSKMEAVGRLAGGIAHEFNNMLTTILGNIELIRMTIEPGNPVMGHLADIHDAAERAAGLTHQLLAFGRKQMLRFRRMEVNRVVVGACSRLEACLGEGAMDGVTLVVEVDQAAGWIDADPAQLEHVVISLVTYAREGLAQGGRITVTTATVSLEESAARRLEGLVPGLYVRLTVADCGPGMSAETLSHLFEPFFSSRGEGVGNGLGLATIYGIVRQSNGSITVRSVLGQGTTFEMFFPRSPEGN